MGWWGRLFGERREEALPLYNAVVTRGRAEHWYVDGGVPDTLEGRFDTIATVLAFVLLRLESEPAATPLSVQLTERFVDDMDSQLRQIGIGDLVVGKQMGKMMSLLGGIRSLFGPLLGAVIVGYAVEYFKNQYGDTQFHLVAMGLLLALVVLFMPDGIIPAATSQIGRAHV